MQFQYNSDYPGVSGHSAAIGLGGVGVDAIEFPAAQPLPCARITTRVYHPNRNEVSTVQNVLVRTMGRSQGQSAAYQASEESSMSSDDFSSSSDGSDDMAVESSVAQQPSEPAIAVGFSPVGDGEDRAYWIQRTVREAIYGRVLFATVLKRRRLLNNSQQSNNLSADWEVTSEFCAVKEMSWQHIRKERDRLAEDPIKEVAAMQYLKRWHQYIKGQNATDDFQGVQASFRAIMETNVMMPLDLLSDDRNLYSVMPYCDGGELFERLDLNERFSEDEARYWMHQVCRGLATLQTAGVCHRDLSLENMLVHQSGALIIDLGMCLRVPLAGLIGQENGGSESAVNGRSSPRGLMRPQGTCGKWIYMSPEIYQNKEPFDGFAVDMWAAGVILFLMLTGFPPWERACATDERFKYMTAGYLVQMLTEWDIGLTSDAMDLLQRMLFLDPKDRLSLEQVLAHPWMVSGRQDMPQGIGAFR